MLWQSSLAAKASSPNEHILASRSQADPLIPESNRSSKDCVSKGKNCYSFRIFMYTGASPQKSWCYPAQGFCRCWTSSNRRRIQMNLKAPRPLTPICLLLLPDTVQFRHNNRPLNFLLQLGADCKCESCCWNDVSGDLQMNILSFQRNPIYPVFIVNGFRDSV